MALLESYTHIGFTCFEEDRGKVLPAVRNVLAEIPSAMFSESQGAVDMDRIYADCPEPSGRIARNLMLFSPRVRSVCTVMFANLSDNWLTLATRVSRDLDGAVYQFSLSSKSDPWPSCSFRALRAGRDMRLVRAMKDSNRWEFFEKGEMLSVEDDSVYRKRRIKDRIDSAYVIALATRLGFPIGDDGFWESDRPAIYFEEQIQE